MLNIYLKYALLHEKTPKEIAIDCGISLNAAYRILKTGKLNKLNIAGRIKKYLHIPDEEFEEYWNNRGNL